MFLSRPDILEYIRGGKLYFEPKIPEDRVRQVSIDLFLGRRFTTFKNAPAYLPSIRMHPSLWESADLFEHREDETFLLQPGQLVLAQTLERVHIPNDLVGFVEGRSSFARIGVTIHVTAPKIDPGFAGQMTLEMANFGKLPVELRAGIDMPAQLLLARVSTPLEISDLYGNDPADVFQGQTDPVPHSNKP